MASMRALKWGLCAVLCMTAIACGGGGGGGGAGVGGSSSGGVGSSSSSSGGSSTSSSSSGGSSSSSSGGVTTGNVANVIVDQGPSNNSVNTLFTSVTRVRAGQHHQLPDHRSHSSRHRLLRPARARAGFDRGDEVGVARGDAHER